MNFLKENYIVVLVFLISTGFFVYQHTTGISWDFSTYVLNAKYIFSDGSYFEWARAPIAPFIIGIFSVFGWKATEYLYIILVSTLFLYSSIKISKKFGLQKELFYIISLSFFALNSGLSVGTELLSLSLIELSIAYIDNWKSGIFIGLSVLTRYNNIIYLPVLLFKKYPKKIFLSLVLIFLILFPWLVFNFYRTGDPFTSMIDSYIMNVKFRGSYWQNINLNHILLVTNIFTPLMIIGIIKKIKKPDKNSTIVFLFLILTLIAYYKVPFKFPRYIFNLILPLSYFSCMVFKEKMRNILLLAIFVISLCFAVYFFQPLSNSIIYKDVAQKLDNCDTRSNAWVYLNYLGFESGPSPWKYKVPEMVKEGERFVFFTHIIEPEYTRNQTFINQLTSIEKTDKYIIIGNSSLCKKQEGYAETYFENAREAFNINMSKYEVLLDRKICHYAIFEKEPILKGFFCN